MMDVFPRYITVLTAASVSGVGGWLNADGTSELILLGDDAYNREAAFNIFKTILNSYCERLEARKSQSNGQNKQEEYA